MFKLSPDSALTLPVYRRWLVAQFAFHCSSWLMYMAEAWLAYTLTKSPTVLGLLSVMNIGPVLFVSVYGGYLADKYRGALLVRALHWAAFAQALLVGTLYVVGLLNIELLLGLTLIRGCIGALNAPVRQASAVRMLPDKRFVASVQALTSMSQNLARCVGPTVASALIAFTGQGTPFFAAALLCLPFVWAASLVPNHTSKGNAASSSLKESSLFIWDNPKVASLVALIAANCVLLMPYSTMFAAYAKEVLAGDVGLAGLLTGIGAPAAILASMYHAHLLKRFSPLRLAQASLAFGAVAEVCLGLVHSVPLALAASVVAGGASVCALVAASTYIQTTVEDRMRGKVSSLVLMCNMGVAPLGALLMGVMSAQVGVSAMYVSFGTALLVCVVVSTLRNSTRRRLQAV